MESKDFLVERVKTYCGSEKTLNVTPLDYMSLLRSLLKWLFIYYFIVPHTIYWNTYKNLK